MHNPRGDGPDNDPIGLKQSEDFPIVGRQLALTDSSTFVKKFHRQPSETRAFALRKLTFYASIAHLSPHES